ncbi:ABC transporter ATP-binding protein [Paenibacillus sp. SYP-B3998]|uniref:ABC transporter ATP-binding protein n=1 Tax=Paenibacillus sp. SYP-B3998 TaxID=2678564 RepID=A0A6G3ZWB3_9BACL|nr:ABC transporter ATP-binding protein [Paenibacillus sp. SYP-B3998]NEW06405.1 ABC transporter ATP-binding protein [Paenibacillus sp. SYP-B3998]
MMSFMDRKRKIQYSIGIGVSTIIQTLFPLSFSLVVQSLVKYAESRDASLLFQALFVLAGSLVLLNLVAPTFMYMFHRSVELTMVDIKERLYRKICKFQVGYLERNHNGDLVSRMNNDVLAMEVTYGGFFMAILLEIMVCIGSIVMMFFIQWQFACASFLILLSAFLISTRFVGYIRVMFNESLQITAKMTEKFSDFIGGIRLVKLFHISPILAQYGKLNEQVTEVSTQIASKNGMLNAVNHFVSYITFCGIIVIGSLLYAYGIIGMGDVAALAVLQVYLSQSFMNLGTLLSLVQKSLAGAHRVQEIFDENEEPERLGTLEHDRTSSTMVEFQGVDFAYQSDKKVLCEMSMQIHPGQVTAIVGASGSGKSTIIKLLLGFYPMDGGAILIQGKSLGHYTVDELRRQMAYVPQDAFLFTGTIEDNIRYGNPQATEDEVIEAAKAAYADHFIQEFPEQYKTQVGERGASLSGGQRQRIAIARAVLKNAPILLLDEATSALDTESEYWVQQALNQLMKGRTTILIAHRLSTVEKADFIFVMNKGTVVEKGTHQELIERRGYYSRLYG